MPRTLWKVFSGGGGCWKQLKFSALGQTLSFGLGLGPKLTISHIQSRPFTSSTQALSLSRVWHLRPNSCFNFVLKVKVDTE